MPIEFRRADPTGITPSDDPSTAVALATPDRSVITLGGKRRSAGSSGFISRSAQQSYIGSVSGYAGSTYRTQPSHGSTLIVGFDPVFIPEDTVRAFDQEVKDQLADLIYRKLIIVSLDGSRFSPSAMRTYS